MFTLSANVGSWAQRVDCAKASRCRRLGVKRTCLGLAKATAPRAQNQLNLDEGKFAIRWGLRAACFARIFFEHDEWRNENSKSSQELFACGRLAAAVSMDDARGGANAVSISEGVSLTDAIGKADAPFCVSDPIVVVIIAMPKATQAIVVRTPRSRRGGPR